MDIKILDSWLREFLDTNAKPSEIAKYLSLCGPSVERIHEIESDFVYDIEITTNRIDEAGVYGIAREASVILPRFGFKAKLLSPVKTLSLRKDVVFTKNVMYLDTKVDAELCPRFTAVLINDVKFGKSPEKIAKRLESSGIRAVNNIVDISNYVMLELGQPVHTFDYDKIKGAKMVVRESKKGEEIKTLDGREFTLPGGDIVIEDGEGRLIDLAGIMGGALSMVDENTKNVLLFVQTYNPTKIRKTSMALAQRSMAATIFEKSTDTELVGTAILEAIELFKSLCGGTSSKEILDIYPHPYKVSSIDVNTDYIARMLGVDISKKEISNYLSALEFECSWLKDKLNVKVPSFRAKDIKGPEDVLEEIARIYGYHNLPSLIMTGEIPVRAENPKFNFETNLKNIISGFGGTEVYTLSLVPESYTSDKHLKLKNPLGPETESLRTSLMPSIIEAAKNNLGTINKFHLFEIANIYLPRLNDLPEERQTLGGIFAGYEFRNAKGIVEGILKRLNVESTFKTEEARGFDASKCAFIYHKNQIIGKVGIVQDSEMVYYEFDVALLFEDISIPSFKPIPKYPAQIEDLTFVLPEKTKVGEVISQIYSISHRVIDVELKDVYNNSYTFNISYQDATKTLTNGDVDKVRKEIITSLKSKFGANIKE